MGVLDGGGDRRRRGSFGMNLGRPIVTSGDVAYCARATHSSKITLRRTCYLLRLVFSRVWGGLNV